MNNLEKLKTIAHEYVRTETDSRSYSQVYEEMCDFFRKKWLTQAWLDGCFNAIHKGKYVLFSHNPETKAYGWLAGDDEESVAQALKGLSI